MQAPGSWVSVLLTSGDGARCPDLRFPVKSGDAAHSLGCRVLAGQSSGKHQGVEIVMSS